MHAHGLHSATQKGSPCGLSQCDSCLSDLAWVQVSAGAAHSLFVGQHGQLWGCGSNTELQSAEEQSMSSIAAPQRILGAAGRPVRFAVAAGSHSLAVLEQQPKSNEQLRRSFGTPLASSHDQWASRHTVSAFSPSFGTSFASLFAFKCSYALCVNYI